jgi:hypothetical protein
MFHTEGVQAHWQQTTVGEHGELVLENLPFEAGQPVDVLVIAKGADSKSALGGGLRGSVLSYDDPLEPVANEDWDVLR